MQWNNGMTASNGSQVQGNIMREQAVKAGVPMQSLIHRRTVDTSHMHI